MISFAGIDLSEPSGTNVEAWIAANIKTEHIFPLAYRTSPGFLFNGPLLNQTAEESCPVIPGSFFWPWGASRFARGHFIVSRVQLDAIRAKVFKNGNEVHGNFVMDDGDSSISTNLWMLPAFPLQQSPAELGLHLLTFVDDRYWWWGHKIDLEVIPGQTKWTDLYAQIGDVIGETIVVDPISSDYDKPSFDYATNGCFLPPILDAIAWSVQQRIVRDLDGSLAAENYATAQATMIANQSLGFNPYAGGTLDLDPRK